VKLRYLILTNEVPEGTPINLLLSSGTAIELRYEDGADLAHELDKAEMALHARVLPVPTDA
jgi:hypothetical protein